MEWEEWPPHDLEFINMIYMALLHISICTAHSSLDPKNAMGKSRDVMSNPDTTHYLWVESSNKNLQDRQHSIKV